MTKPALLIAAVLIAGPTGAALAVQPGADWMPMDQVVRKLGEAGYVEIRSLKAEDGRWEGRAVKDGKPASFAVDPKSGAVIERAKADKDARREKSGDDD